MAQAKAYPLHWPDGVKRTRRPKPSAFKRRSFGQARDAVLDEIRRMNGKAVVVSTNLPLRIDGIPYANGNPGHDHGVAVYFQRRGKLHAIACDSFSRIDENAYAIAKTIQALRAIERYGSSQLGDQAFSAFAALPPAEGDTPRARHWRDVLDVPEGISEADQLLIAKSRYRDLVKAAHPDRGGTHEQVLELNGALARATEELGR